MRNIDMDLVNRVNVAWNDFANRLAKQMPTEEEWADFKKDYSISSPARWYTNGQKNIKLFDFEQIPEGFERGFTKNSTK